jgi:hypothetical protein
VRHPGDHPLVPATPNIVCNLLGYEVTLNETLEVTESQTLSKGTTWTSSTEETYSLAYRFEWEFGGSFTYSWKTGETGAEIEVNGHVGGGWDETNSTATTTSTEESVLDEQGWSEARSLNPTDAAHIKLLLRIENRGTAPISNLVPTLTLRIGGRNVATFEPGGAAVSMLVPGQVYPDGSGVHWVVSTLGSGAPLSLTMSELRALERGAPVSISLTQTRGDVMRLAPGGKWESIGDTNQYVSRCHAVCARVRIDLEEGTTVQQLVYADDTPSSPKMTLGTALAHLGVDVEGDFTYFDANGTPHVRSLAGFTCVIDPDTLRRNGWTLTLDGAAANTPPADFALSDTRLFPTSLVLLRAPRDPVTTPGPVIHYAYLDAATGEVQASAADYGGIDAVTVVDDTGAVLFELAEELPDSGFYRGSVPMDDTFDATRLLRVIVTNNAGETAAADLGRLFQQPLPVAPDFTLATYDHTSGYLHVRVVNGSPTKHPNSNVQWVKAFWPNQPGRVENLVPVVNAFSDPTGYYAVVPYDATTAFPLEVVAYVAPDVYTVQPVTAADTPDLGTYRSEKATLNATLDVDNPLFGATTYEYTSACLDMDAQNDTNVVRTVTGDALPSGVIDLKLALSAAGDSAWIHLNMPFKRMPTGTDYAALSKVQVQSIQLAGELDDATPLAISKNSTAAAYLKEGDVLAVVTSGGRFGKIKVESAPVWTYTGSQRYSTVKLVLRFVAWN